MTTSDEVQLIEVKSLEFKALVVFCERLNKWVGMISVTPHTLVF